jgi:superfamily II DNA or RNA helicase
MFAVLECIRPGVLGTYSEFLTEWGQVYGGDNAMVTDPEAFGAYLRAEGLMLRRTRAEVGRELPEMTVVPHYIDADPKALEEVAGTCAELCRFILRGQQTEKGELMHAGGELDYRLRQATGIAKAAYVAKFVELLVDSGEKVVLYGWHHEVYNLWRDLLAGLGPAFFTGRESTTQKERAKQEFISGEARVLIMSLRAGAGLDGLQGAAHTVVFGELDWSPGVHDQCAGRVHRDGQHDPVTAYYLIAETGSDPVIADVLGLKRSQSDPVLDPDRLVELQTSDPNRITRMAEAFLRQRGEPVPQPASDEPNERGAA